MQNTPILTITVNNLKISTIKGLYKEEQLVENTFEVTAKVQIYAAKLDENEYICYEQLAYLLRDEMQKEEHLLENVLRNIAMRIKSKWEKVHYLQIGIKKCNPAFENMNVENTQVMWEENIF